ncbi:MAG: hypothetical protein UE116_01185 [Clostridia bacterium]|nr:hypothetical protein [Clostridia bacterium]
MVLEIACFLRGLGRRTEKFLSQRDYVNYKKFIITSYTNLIIANKLIKQGGVA